MHKEHLPNTEYGMRIHIVEECAEVTQAYMKIMRFGPSSYHPADENKITNEQLFLKELDDLEEAIKRFRKQYAANRGYSEEVPRSTAFD